MSEFFRMPKAWHDSLDASLPPVRTIDFMTGSQTNRIQRRLLHCLNIQSPIKKSDFCKQEGIKTMSLNSALDTCYALVWEDQTEVGIFEA